MIVVKPTPHITFDICPITANAMNQSGLEAEPRNRRQARENM